MKTPLVATSISALTLTLSLPCGAKDDAIGLLFKGQTLETPAGKERHRLMGLDYERKINKYFSLYSYAAAGVSDTETRTDVDTFIDDPLNVTPQQATYTSVQRIKYDTGLSLVLTAPIVEGWSAYGQLGYQWVAWESEGFTAFADTPPSSTPQDDFLAGADQCQVTGQEFACGNDVLPTSSTERFSTGFYEIGLEWQVGDNTAIKAGYADTFDKENVLRGLILGFRYMF